MRDDGRGRYFINGTEMRAHWAAWEIQHGEPVPEGYRLEQECNHPDCVRHWKLGGRRKKLTREAIEDVLTSTLGLKRMARKYGVSPLAIRWHRQRCVLA